MSRPPRSRSGLPAFSLIEILIAVLILALGLLGLGALFPVVLRDQRISGDRVAAAIAYRNIEAQLRGNDWLHDRAQLLVYNNATPPEPVHLLAEYGGFACLAEPWRAASAEATLATGAPALNRLFRFSRFGDWETDRRWDSELGGVADFATALRDEGDLYIGLHLPDPGAAMASMVQTRTADISGKEASREFSPAAVRLLQQQLGRTDNLPVERLFLPAVRIGLASRLLTTTGSDTRNPDMVWDAVFRRLSPGSTRLQAAVFIRRVDPRIVRPWVSRPGGGGDVRASLRQIFSGERLSANQRRLPLGVDRDGLPTLDGSDGNGGLAYAAPISVAAEFLDPSDDESLAKRDRIHFPDAEEEEQALIGQPGQKLVDNLGNVYTVVDYGEDGRGFYARVEPPVPASVRPTNDAPVPPVPLNWEGRIQQVALTPQVPVAVYITEVGQ